MKVNEDIIKKVSSLTKGYNSRGKDLNRLFVDRGVDGLKNGDEFIAKRYFEASGLSKSGLLYFAIRKYLGDKEEYVLKFILDNY